MLILFSGVSGSGKNTIINEILKRNKDYKMLSRSSGTTREIRESDKDYNAYVYMNEEEFKTGIEEGKFFEYEVVHGNYYGLLREALERVENSQDTFLRDIDVQGNIKLRNYFEGKKKVVSIFLDAPNEELVKRLKERGESDERIKVRLSRSAHEREYKDNYDLVIENIDIEKTVSSICEFLSKQ